MRWCEENHISLNCKNYKHLQFNKKKETSLNGYFLDGEEVANVNVIRDLGIYFDSRLTFNAHRDYCCNKALKLLGFIKRITAEFVGMFKRILMFIEIKLKEYNVCP